MKKSLKYNINELVCLVLDYENKELTDEKTRKNIIAHHLDKLISGIKRRSFLFDITPTDFKKIDVIIESPLNIHPELGPVIVNLLTGEEEKKMYFTES